MASRPKCDQLVPLDPVELDQLQGMRGLRGCEAADIRGGGGAAVAAGAAGITEARGQNSLRQSGKAFFGILRWAVPLNHYEGNFEDVD